MQFLLTWVRTITLMNYNDYTFGRTISANNSTLQKNKKIKHKYVLLTMSLTIGISNIFTEKIVLKPILNLTKFSLSFLAAKYVIYAKESPVMTETHH